MILGEVLRRWRQCADITVRDAAKRIGISPATLCRVEQGESMDGVILGKILTWMLSPSEAKKGAK